MKIDWLKGPWLAMIVGFILAASFVVIQPGYVVKDAGEYDALAQSILQGKYQIDGKPSMLREPGYPVFRALIRLVSDQPSIVLWIQVLLFVAIIWLVWDTFRRFDQKLALVGVWSAALSYGLAIYASRHLLEMFTAFLVALVIWLAVRVMSTERPWRELVAFSVASSILILTRASLVLIPLGLLTMFVLVWRKNVGMVEIIKRKSLVVLILVLLVSPWIIRNGQTFGVWGVAGRSGIQVAARAYKAHESWGRLRDSMGSVLIGRSLLTVKYPEAKPIILEQWKWVWNRFEAWKIDRNEIDADRTLQKEAFGILFTDASHVIRGGLWSIVDLGRLLALPSPLAAEFGIEGMYWPRVENKTIWALDIWVLVLAHLLQMIWWVGIIAGMYLGFREYGKRFFPGYVVLAVVIAHIPADNIVRYAAPIYPWLVSVAVLGWLPIVKRWLPKR